MLENVSWRGIASIKCISLIISTIEAREHLSVGLSLGIVIAGLLANAFVVLVKLPHWINIVDQPNAEQHRIMRSVLATVPQCLTRQGNYLSARNGGDVHAEGTLWMERYPLKSILFKQQRAIHPQVANWLSSSKCNGQWDYIMQNYLRWRINASDTRTWQASFGWGKDGGVIKFNRVLTAGSVWSDPVIKGVLFS